MGETGKPEIQTEFLFKSSQITDQGIQNPRQPREWLKKRNRVFSQSTSNFFKNFLIFRISLVIIMTNKHYQNKKLPVVKKCKAPVSKSVWLSTEKQSQLHRIISQTGLQWKYRLWRNLSYFCSQNPKRLPYKYFYDIQILEGSILKTVLKTVDL